MNTDTSKIIRVAGRGLPVPGNDIDTDRIIPARYLKCVTFDELGQYAFYDVRFDANGNLKGHPLDDPKHKGASILIVNRNFGCGSSREHAPQSIKRFGVKAIVGESFAEIFADNCTAIGLPIVTASADDIAKLMALAQEKPGQELTLDLEKRTLDCGAFTLPVNQSDQVRNALISGTWDTTGELISVEKQIRATADRLPYINGFAS